MDKVEQLIQSLLVKIDSLDSKVSKIDHMDSQITEIKLCLENITNRNISLLMEGQDGMNEQFQKLDQVAEDVEEIKVKVTALENVTRDNTSQIRELKIAK
mgnify:CR=1 FL=1